MDARLMHSITRVPLLALGLFGLGQASPQAQSPSTQPIEVIAIGDINDIGLRFWNPQGKVDLELANLAGDTFNRQLYGAVPFRFGFKNRYILLKKQDTKASVSFNGTGDVSYMGSQGPYYLVRICTPFTLKTTTIDYLVPPLRPESCDIKFAPGEKGKLANTLFEIPGKPLTVLENELKQDNGSYQYPYKLWSFILGKSDPIDGPLFFTYVLLDKKRQRIPWVDEKGHAASAPKAPALFLDYSDGEAKRKKVEKVSVQPMCFEKQIADGVLNLTTNVDPKTIGWIRVLHSASKRYSIDGIRLDPSSDQTALELRSETQTSTNSFIDVPLSSSSQIEIVGIASISPDRLELWNTEGRAMPEQAAQLTSRLVRSNSSTWSLCPGLKNRYIVYKQSGDISELNWQIPDRKYVANSSELIQQISQLRFAWVVMDTKVDTIHPKVRLVQKEPDTIRGTCTTRGTITLNGQHYRVSSITPVNTSEFPTRPATKRYQGSAWIITFERQEDEATKTTFGYGMSAYVKDLVIRYVDLKGNPITDQARKQDIDPTQWHAERDAIFSNTKFEPKNLPIIQSIFDLRNMTPKGFSIFTNINPERIETFTTEILRVFIKELPALPFEPQKPR